MNDKQFATHFMVILVIMIGIAILILVLANWIVRTPDYASDPMTREHIVGRIKPVGEVNVGAVPTAHAGTETADASSATPAAARPPEEVYKTACFACHETGVLNAPKYGDKAAWAPRVQKGVDALYNNAIKGLNQMPAKGGRVDLSDDEVKQVVDYMLQALK